MSKMEPIHDQLKTHFIYVQVDIVNLRSPENVFRVLELVPMSTNLDNEDKLGHTIN